MSPLSTRCGAAAQATCMGSACCSSGGFCGEGDLYCGEGMQAEPATCTPMHPAHDPVQLLCNPRVPTLQEGYSHSKDLCGGADEGDQATETVASRAAAGPYAVRRG